MQTMFHLLSPNAKKLEGYIVEKMAKIAEDAFELKYVPLNQLDYIVIYGELLRLVTANLSLAYNQRCKIMKDIKHYIAAGARIVKDDFNFETDIENKTNLGNGYFIAHCMALIQANLKYTSRNAVDHLQFKVQRWQEFYAEVLPTEQTIDKICKSGPVVGWPIYDVIAILFGTSIGVILKEDEQKTRACLLFLSQIINPMTHLKIVHSSGM